MTSGIFITEVQSTSAVVNWGLAADDRTPLKQVRYQLVWAQSAAELATLEQVAVLPPSAFVMAETAYVLRHTLTNLRPNTTIYVAVVAADAAGNRVLYPSAGITTPPPALGPDATPPVPGSGLTFTSISSTAVTVSWGVASDDRTPAPELVYRLVMAPSAAAIDTVAEVAGLSGDGVLFNGTSDLGKTAVSGLASGTLHHFALLVRDAAGNQALYPLAAQRTADVTPPVVGSGITFTNVTNGSVAVNWGAASDNVTPAGDLEYRVVIADVFEKINTVQSALLLSGTSIKQDFSKSIAPVIITGLGENFSLFAAVLVRDTAGNMSLYPPQSVTTLETQPPVPGSGLTFSEHASASVRVSWGAAADNVTASSDLHYRLVRSPVLGEVDTVAEGLALTGSAVVLDWSRDVRTAVATGLDPETEYHFADLARSAEATASNWSGGSVGTGEMARGHTDVDLSSSASLDGADLNETGLALAHPPTDSNGFYGTGQSSGEQRRTQTLPNGQVIWDLGGNVWQWVRDERSGLGIPGADDSAGVGTISWVSFVDDGSNRFSETLNRIFGNFGSGGLQFSETQNVGQLYGGAFGAVLRGGRWDRGWLGGAFAVGLHKGINEGSDNAGFRCSLAFAESP